MSSLHDIRIEISYEKLYAQTAILTINLQSTVSSLRARSKKCVALGRCWAYDAKEETETRSQGPTRQPPLFVFLTYIYIQPGAWQQAAIFLEHCVIFSRPGAALAVALDSDSAAPPAAG